MESRMGTWRGVKEVNSTDISTHWCISIAFQYNSIAHAGMKSEFSTT